MLVGKTGFAAVLYSRVFGSVAALCLTQVCRMLRLHFLADAYVFFRLVSLQASFFCFFFVLFFVYLFLQFFLHQLSFLRLFVINNGFFISAAENRPMLLQSHIHSPVCDSTPSHDIREICLCSLRRILRSFTRWFLEGVVWWTLHLLHLHWLRLIRLFLRHRLLSSRAEI